LQNPDESTQEERQGSGFEGSIAQLRFYSRALSPIHVRILCDQGPPEPVRIRDRRLMQMLACVHTVARSRVGQSALGSEEWLQSLVKGIVVGTLRCQQACLRILRLLLPAVDPCSVTMELARNAASLSVKGHAVLPGAVVARPGGEGRPTLLEYFLWLIGVTLHRSSSLCGPARFGDMSAEDVVLNLPYTMRAACAAGVLDPPRDDSSDGDAKHWVSDEVAVSMEEVSECACLAAELVELLHALLEHPRWRAAIVQRVSESLRALPGSLPLDDRTPHGRRHRRRSAARLR
jgi:hypothetical protein